VVPPAPPPFTWTGCYVGGHVGGGWGHKTWSDHSPERTDGEPLSFIGGFGTTASVSHNTSGWLGGGQVGCDYQFTPVG
jgi:outer membrane immunogenic protein